MPVYKSNGKLLLTGEYVVLDGALALAIPTKYGQTLEAAHIQKKQIIWQSLDHNNNLWYEESFSFNDIIVSNTSKFENPISKQLIRVLNATKQLNTNFLETNTGYQVTTALNLPKNWGLGTSSTLINNIGNWAKVNPYKLLELSFGGSGYDIACAQHNSPITYQLKEASRQVKAIPFKPSYSKHIFFVYLNKKQNSRDSISQYNSNKQHIANVLPQINKITSAIISCKSLFDFECLINKHEQLISSLIQIQPIKTQLFSDYEGAIKSLGGWGGDFILTTSKTNPSTYFKSKGYHTIIPYSEMIF